jgi:hypothetical protein
MSTVYLVNPVPCLSLASFSLYRLQLHSKFLIRCLIIHGHAIQTPHLDVTIDFLYRHHPGHPLQIRPSTPLQVDLMSETPRPKMHSPHSTYAK